MNKSVCIIVLFVVVCLAFTATLACEKTAYTADSTPPMLLKGDKIVFGHYAGEEIVWRILEIEDDGTLLLLSEYGLDMVVYNRESIKVTWANCDLRLWLNSDFLETAFSEDERSLIQVSQVVYEYHFIERDEMTEDRCYLLSTSEINHYLKSDEERICYATEQAKRNGAVTNSLNACCWMVRTAGGSFAVEFVDLYGETGYFHCVDVSGSVVRPVIRVKPRR